MSKRARCHCGVYVDCHQRIDHKPWRAPRLWLWYIDHSIWQHLAAPVWLRLPGKWRWDVVSWLNRSRRRCWSDLVSDALAHRENDACDTHVPSIRPNGAGGCANVCDWSHFEHVGEHPCSCYCGKFQFIALDGGIERRT